MIKLKKIVAVALAATMCMGVSMTAFASTGGQASANAELSDMKNIASPDFVPGTTSVKGTDGKGGTNADLKFDPAAPTKSSETYQSIDTKGEVEAIMAENGVNLDGATVVPIGYTTVKDISNTKDNVVTFTLAPSQFVKNRDGSNADLEKYTTGDTVYALMETGLGEDNKGTGVWELIEGKVNDKGMVDFTVDHKGTIVVIKMMKNGQVLQLEVDPNTNEPVKPPVNITPSDPNQPITPVTPDQPGTSTNASNGQNAKATGNAWTSPKTGEF